MVLNQNNVEHCKETRLSGDVGTLRYEISDTNETLLHCAMLKLCDLCQVP